jgi:hypothetical protein
LEGEENGAPEIFLAVQPIEIPEQNYAKTVSRPATANPSVYLVAAQQNAINTNGFEANMSS